MRQIKFRAKDINTKLWVYGSLVNNELHGCCIVLIIGGCSFQAPVDPETVGQFIGIQDENGVDIFEDEICEYKPISLNGPYTGLVKIQSGSARIDQHWLSHINHLTIKVLGNIHDNSELLEKVENA